MEYGHIIPEWIWVTVIGTVVIGLVKALWGQRNRGLITAEKHAELCGEMKRVIDMNFSELLKTFNDSLKDHSQSLTVLLNTKFENLDEKIENKVFKEIRSMNNGIAKVVTKKRARK